MKISEHTCELAFSVEYAHPSEGVVEAKFITLKAPRITHMAHTAVLKQAFTRAIVALRNANSGKAENEEAQQGSGSEISADDVITILETSPESIAVVIDNFKKFMINSELFLLDGETQVTTALYDKIEPEDMYTIIGTYYARFIIASLTK